MHTTCIPLVCLDMSIESLPGLVLLSPTIELVTLCDDCMVCFELAGGGEQWGMNIAPATRPGPAR